MKKILPLTVILLLIFLVSMGCSPGKEEMEVRSFVQNYASILQRVYVKADLNVLVPFTTEKEIKKVFPIIQALNATDNVMNTEILEFKIKKAGVKGNAATVTTSERWRFWWQDIKSGAITKPKVEESYKLQYHLVKVNGQWKVDSIENLNK